MDSYVERRIEREGKREDRNKRSREKREQDVSVCGEIGRSTQKKKK